jgi:hypothetical protein
MTTTIAFTTLQLRNVPPALNNICGTLSLYVYNELNEHDINVKHPNLNSYEISKMIHDETNKKSYSDLILSDHFIWFLN